MMYILNDYSIDNQFEDIDSFLDSLLYYTIPLFKVMDKYKLDLFKNHEIYNLKIVRDLSFIKLLNINGSPEITRLKSLLNKRLHEDPYWEKQDNISHDCMVEAIKRGAGLISFEHDQYLEHQVEYKIENIFEKIPNSYKKSQLIEQLWTKRVIDIHEYLGQKHNMIQNFCIIGGKNYFTELIKTNDIKQDEVNKIVNDLNDFMYRYLNKQDLGRLSKNLEANLHEFRTTIADSKELRILYCINQSRIVFLNCFIKKQEKTPEGEKGLGRRLREMVISK